jgi:hypothetical protein
LVLGNGQDVGLGTPQVRRVQGDPGDNFHDYVPLWPDEELPLCLVQGYSPRAFRVEQGRGDDRGNTRHRYFNRGNQTPRGARDHRDSPRPTPRDRAIRPDQRRRKFLTGVQCEACKHLGHVASTCDMLAMALFVEKYIKQSLSNKDWRKIESDWIEMWKNKLVQPQRLLSQVMKAYCLDLDITSDHLDRAMDWDCWPVDTYGDFAGTQGVDGTPE